jgi:hypothetical protein
MNNLNGFGHFIKTAILCFLCINLPLILKNKIYTFNKLLLIISPNLTIISLISLTGNLFSPNFHLNIMITIIMQYLFSMPNSYLTKNKIMTKMSMLCFSHGKLLCKPCLSLLSHIIMTSNQNKH